MYKETHPPTRMRSLMSHRLVQNMSLIAQIDTNIHYLMLQVCENKVS